MPKVPGVVKGLGVTFGEMTKTLRTCIRMSKMATPAIAISCHITSVSVWMAPVISRVRS